MKREQIEKWMEAHIFRPDRIEYAGHWMGYEVWMPVWDAPPCIGPPVFALVRGESIRRTNPDEGFDVLDWLIKTGRVGDDRVQS